MKKSMSALVLFALVTGCAQPYVASISYRGGRSPIVVQSSPSTRLPSYPTYRTSSSYQPFVSQAAAEQKVYNDYYTNAVLGMLGSAYAYGLKNLKEGKGSYYTNNSRKEDVWAETRKATCESYGWLVDVEWTQYIRC